VFDFHAQEGGYHSVQFEPAEPKPVELAWGMVNGRCMLHVLRDDHIVVRPSPPNNLDEIPLEGALALAYDDRGTLALFAASSPGGAEPRVYVSDNGEDWQYRVVQSPKLLGGRVRVALGRNRAIVTIQGEGAWSSTALDEAFTPYKPLAAAGAIAFDEGILFAAIRKSNGEAVIRVDEAGVTTRVAEIASSDGVAHQIAELAWDASRHTLWGACPQAGLVLMRAPDASLVS
jgi:hypothetical protein